MRLVLYLLVLIMLYGGAAVMAQENQAPVSVGSPVWHVDHRTIPKKESSRTSPQRELTSDDKNFAREKRNQTLRGSTPEPSEMTADGSRQKMDKAQQEAESTGGGDQTGYLYQASFVNNTKKAVAVIYWEYRFTELADPNNVVRRQFLCAANMKPAAKKDLWIFTLLGPSGSISIESLKNVTTPLFDEKVYINRIEFTDDSVLQRPGWNFDDVKKGVASATSTPWGNEVCRAI